MLRSVRLFLIRPLGLCAFKAHAAEVYAELRRLARATDLDWNKRPCAVFLEEFIRRL
jgi:hypothetical protein